MTRKGFTIVEALVVMMILGLIGGAIMAFLPPSARLFQRGGAESQAGRACAKAIQEMGPVCREAMDLNVVVRDAGTGEIRLELSLPQKQTDATTGEDLVVYPLTVGSRVAFYRSDSSGSPSATGDKFWRAEYVGGTWQPSEMLAEGIVSFIAPTVNTTPPKSVEVLVKGQVKEGSRTARVTQRELLTCRNT